MKGKIKVVFVTVPDEETAIKIAKDIVQSGLAACVNIVKETRSIYMWEGKLEDAVESILIIKTSSSAFKKLKDRIKTVHPYSVPEIIAVDVIDGNIDYIKWVLEETSKKKRA
jgi:periplasmic divalent cation tolerance protein